MVDVVVKEKMLSVRDTEFYEFGQHQNLQMYIISGHV